MPQGGGPRLGDRRVPRGEAGDERVEAVAVDELALGLRGDRLQELAVGLEAGELVGRGLGGPAGLALADGAAVGGGRGRDDAVGAGLLGDVGRRVGAGLAAVGLGVERQVVAAGQGDLEGDLGVVERPVLGVADPDRRARRRASADAASALGRTETSTRPGRRRRASGRSAATSDRGRSRPGPRGGGPSARGRRSGGPRRVPCRTAAPRAPGRSLPAGSRTCDEDHGPRLDVADPAEGLEARPSRPAAAAPRPRSSAVRTHGCSQPSRVSTRR